MENGEQPPEEKKFEMETTIPLAIMKALASEITVPNRDLRSLGTVQTGIRAVYSALPTGSRQDEESPRLK